MKVIVTGGAGFIGSHLSEKLVLNKKIKKVIIIDHFKDGSKKNLINIYNSKKIKIIRENIINFDKIEKIF